MTARRYRSNGFFWTGVDGYRGSYLTSTRTGDYGIYAFDSVNGIFDHSYGSGSPDAGFYIGQCYPCNALITDSEAAYNGLGYSGTNTGGEPRDQELGLAPQPRRHRPEQRRRGEAPAPARHHDRRQPRLRQQQRRHPGDRRRQARRVQRHPDRGRQRQPRAAQPGASTTSWRASPPSPIPTRRSGCRTGNRIVGNVVSKSATADLAAFGGDGNCFTGNTFTTSKPSNIEQVLPCSGTAVPRDGRAGHPEVHRRQEAAVGRLPDGEDAAAAEARRDEEPADREGAARRTTSS